MSRYGRIESGFWHSRKVRKLSESGRFLMLYLLSCPHGNLAGCYVLPDGYISADLGWSGDKVAAAFDELTENELAERDCETCLIRICGWWGHNPIDNSNQAKAVVKEVSLLPDCAVKARLIASIQAIADAHETVLETLSKGFGKPYRNQNRTEQSTTEPNTEGRASRAPDEEFEKFKKVYPSRGPASNPWKPAREVYDRHVKNGEEPESLAIAAEIYAKRCAEQKIVGTDKVAQAVTWLRQERFRDYFDGMEAELARRKQVEDDMRARGYDWIDGKWQKVAA